MLLHVRYDPAVLLSAIGRYLPALASGGTDAMKLTGPFSKASSHYGQCAAVQCSQQVQEKGRSAGCLVVFTVLHGQHGVVVLLSCNTCVATGRTALHLRQCLMWPPCWIGCLVRFLLAVNAMHQGCCCYSDLPHVQILESAVSDPFIINWMNLLSFLLSGLPANGTIAAEVAFMVRVH